MPVLIRVKGDPKHVKESYLVSPEATTTIGRASGNTIVIPDPELVGLDPPLSVVDQYALISREHCEILPPLADEKPYHYTLINKGRNGTVVGGRLVRGEKAMGIGDGSRVSLAGIVEFEFRFTEPGAAQEAKQKPAY